MIVIRVELWSARDGSRTELARMVLDNIGGTAKRRNYRARVFRGRSTADLNKGTVQREGQVLDHPSESVHVWHLVAKALSIMGYGI